LVGEGGFPLFFRTATESNIQIECRGLWLNSFAGGTECRSDLIVDKTPATDDQPSIGQFLNHLIGLFR
jgi:hypothetical protein